MMVVVSIVVAIVIFIMMAMIVVVLVSAGNCINTGGNLVRTGDGPMTIVRAEAASIQPGQHANKHQPCKNYFSQAGGDSMAGDGSARGNFNHSSCALSVDL